VIGSTLLQHPVSATDGDLVQSSGPPANAVLRQQAPFKVISTTDVPIWYDSQLHRIEQAALKVPLVPGLTRP
jgi:hypothetical protein